MSKSKPKSSEPLSGGSNVTAMDDGKRRALETQRSQFNFDAEFWDPTDTDIRDIERLVEVVDSDLSEYSEQLDKIYDLVPMYIHYAWTLAFQRTFKELSENVQSEFASRYSALKRQYDVARIMFPRYYPGLVRLAKQFDYNVDTILDWDKIRPRLSQDNTTHGKDWLEKMQSLLLGKIRKKTSKFELDLDGDICEYNGQPYTCNDSNDGDLNTDDDDGDDIVDISQVTYKTPRKDADLNKKTTSRSRRRKHRTTDKEKLSPPPSTSTVSPDTGRKNKKNKKRKRSIDRSIDSDVEDPGSDDREKGYDDRKEDISNSNRQQSVDELVEEINGIETASSDRLSRINKLADCNRRINDLLVSECSSLNTSVADASSLSKMVKDQLIKAEKGKRLFIDFYQQSSRAVYESYLQTRKLLISRYWWDELSNSDHLTRVKALLRYYNETHPWYQPAAGDDTHYYHSPEPPCSVIARSVLFSKEETNNRWSKLLSSNVDNVSILQLPALAQDKLRDALQWTQTGIINVKDLDSDQACMVAEIRELAYKMHGIQSSLKEHNRHLLAPIEHKVNDSSAASPVTTNNQQIPNSGNSIVMGSDQAHLAAPLGNLPAAPPALPPGAVQQVEVGQR